jgi:DNA-binding response OmpR family regulator
MSAYRIDSDKSSILKLAAVQVSKPFDAEEFVSRVEAVIEDEA